MRTYVLEANDYFSALKVLRTLRKKKAVIHRVLIIASIDDHRKIKNAIARGQQAVIILVR